MTTKKTNAAKKKTTKTEMALITSEQLTELMNQVTPVLTEAAHAKTVAGKQRTLIELTHTALTAVLAQPGAQSWTNEMISDRAVGIARATIDRLAISMREMTEADEAARLAEVPHAQANGATPPTPEATA